MRLLQALVVLLGLASSCLGKGWDNNVCRPGSVSDAAQLPTIPDIFELTMEANFVDRKMTMTIHEVVDSTPGVNMAMMELTATTAAARNISLTEGVIYKFDTNEVISILPIPNGLPVCAVKDMSKYDDRFLFGQPNQPGASKHFTVSGAWRLSKDYPAKKVADAVVRDIPADHYQNCVYMSNMDATLKADWYFSKPSWQNPLGVASIPLRLTVQGNVWNFTNTPRFIQHTYEIVDYRDYLTEAVRSGSFNLPLDTVCLGLKPTMKMPELPSSFSFRGEIIRPGLGGLVSYLRQHYDTKLRMARYTYFPQPDVPNPWGDASEIRSIHDFNTGHAYVIDPYRGNCTIMPIDVNSGDAINPDPNHVRMRTSGELFQLAGGIGNWTYTGTRMLRGLKADTFINVIPDWPPAYVKAHPNEVVYATWELSFLNPSMVQVSGTKIETQELVQFRVVSSIKAEYNSIVNVVDFDEEEPNPAVFSVGQCFTSASTKVPLQFKILANYNATVPKNQAGLQLLVLISITGYTGVSPIRIDNLNLDIAPDDNILVFFDLLSTPVISGDLCVNCGQKTIIPSDDVITLLNDSIAAGNFVIDDDKVSGNNVNLYGLKVEPNSFMRRSDNLVYTNKVVQLDVGAAVGIAIGLFLVGVIVATLILVIIYKVKGPTVMATMSFSPKTFDEGKN